MFGDEQGSAQVMMQVTLDASGEMLPASVTDPITRNAYTPYGAVRGANNLSIDHGWLNKIADTDTGLTYLGARYYDLLTSRFISPDPLMNPKDPLTLDGYMYAGNNPVTFRDVSGLYRPKDPGFRIDLGEVSGSKGGSAPSTSKERGRATTGAETPGELSPELQWIDDRNFGDTTRCELVGACSANPTQNVFSGTLLTTLTAWDTAYRETKPIHALLDILSLVGQGNLGIAASILDGVIYACEGNWGDAILSAAGALPGVPILKKVPAIGMALRVGLKGLGLKTGAEQTHYTGLIEARNYLQSKPAPDIGQRLRDARRLPQSMDYGASGNPGTVLTQFSSDGYLSSYAQYDGEGDLFLVVRVTGRDDLGFATGATADFYSVNESGVGVHPHSQMPGLSGVVAEQFLPAGSRDA